MLVIAKVGAALVQCLSAGNKVQPKDFLTDFRKLAEDATKEKKPRTAEDIAAELRAMGLPVMMGKRE